MNTLYVVMPAYNEEENIRQVVEDWYPVLEGKSEESRLVIADSGSVDDTHLILEELKESHPKLLTLSDTEKQHGPKLIALYDYAIKQGADYIFQTDSDGQTRPEEFARFWKLRRKFDCIIGYRARRGDGKARAFVEKVVCALLLIFFRVRVPDANAPFRLMKASIVEKYLHRLPEDYNLPNIMMTVFFEYYQENVRFCRISFRPRQGGKNSINLPKIFKIGLKALGDFRRFKKAMR